jgi:hypothetical protein
VQALLLFFSFKEGLVAATERISAFVILTVNEMLGQDPNAAVTLSLASTGALQTQELMKICRWVLIQYSSAVYGREWHHRN